MTKKQVTFFLPYPVVQGVYTDVEEATQIIKNQIKNHKEGTQAIVVDSEFVDLFLEHTEQVTHVNFPEDAKWAMAGKFAHGKLKGGKTDYYFVLGTGHLHTGATSSHVTMSIRVLKHLGASQIVQLSTFCSVHSSLPLGELVIPRDHVSLCGRNPLFGVNEDRWGVRFPDMGDAYSTKMVSDITTLSREIQIPLHSLLFGHVIGPVTGSFANANLAQSLSIQALSTGLAPECIVARHCSIPFASLGVVTSSLYPQEKKRETLAITECHNHLSHLLKLVDHYFSQ